MFKIYTVESNLLYTVTPIVDNPCTKGGFRKCLKRFVIKAVRKRVSKTCSFQGY